jgi:hypothetical protein
MRHRFFPHIAGDWHAVPYRVIAKHRGAKCMGWLAGFGILPHYRDGLGNHRLAALMDMDVMHNLFTPMSANAILSDIVHGLSRAQTECQMGAILVITTCTLRTRLQTSSFAPRVGRTFPCFISSDAGEVCQRRCSDGELHDQLQHRRPLDEATPEPRPEHAPYRAWTYPTIGGSRLALAFISPRIGQQENA